MYNQFYLSEIENTDERFHRSHFIIHRPLMFYLAEFKTVEQLDFIAKFLGFSYTLVKEEKAINGGYYREYSLSHTFDDIIGGGFWNLSEIPEGVKPFKALSNGSIVTCYFLNDGKTIHIYRPNPNAKEVYKPLTIEQHIKHHKIYGLI